MIVVKCDKCGRMVHLCKNDVCPICGKTLRTPEFESKPIFKRQEYCEQMLSEGKYADAIKEYNACIALYPNVSSLYWGRLLANHKCMSDEALVQKGVYFEEDDDFFSACAFADAEERAVYNTLKDIREQACGVLLDLINKEKKAKISAMGMDKNISSGLNKVNALREDCASKISALAKLENEIRSTLASGRKKLESGKANLRKPFDSINKLFQDVQGLTEADETTRKAQQQAIDQELELFAKRREEMKQILDSPDFSRIKELSSEAEKRRREIDGVIRELSNCKTEFRQQIVKMNTIQDYYREVAKNTKTVSFESAIRLLGAQQVATAISSIHVRQ